MHPRVPLDLPDECPVSLSLVHLAAGPTVDRECLDARVLKPLGQFHDDLAALVPTEAGLDRDRLADGLYYPFRDHHHLVGVLHHPRASSTASDLAHRAAEIDVDHVASVSAHKFRGVVRHLRGLDHRVRVASVDLDSDRGLVVRSLELGVGLLGVPDQTLGRNELSVDHVRSLLPAYPSEGSVCHILHRSQKHGPYSKIYVAYCHNVVIL